MSNIYRSTGMTMFGGSHFNDRQSRGRILRGREQRLASGITVRKEDKTFPCGSQLWSPGIRGIGVKARRKDGRPQRQQVQYGLQRHGAMQNQAFPGYPNAGIKRNVDQPRQCNQQIGIMALQHKEVDQILIQIMARVQHHGIVTFHH
jgi:hypothetical protein